MKKIILLGVATAALAALPASAQQARGGFDGDGVTRSQAENQVRTMFARVDTNRDGFVTRDEAESFRGAIRAERGERREDRREARFSALDTNRDGSISRAEFFAQHDRSDGAERRGDRLQRRGQGRGFAGRVGGRLFERLDSDRDGRISLAEATDARLAAFDRADLNRDGRVTREERRAVRSERQSRRG